MLCLGLYWTHTDWGMATKKCQVVEMNYALRISTRFVCNFRIKITDSWKLETSIELSDELASYDAHICPRWADTGEICIRIFWGVSYYRVLVLLTLNGEKPDVFEMVKIS